MLDTCLVTGCGKPSQKLFDGKPLCGQHYGERFIAELMGDYDGWEPNHPPSKRFRYLLGRFYEEYASRVGDSYLSAARIRDRGFDFVKVDGGCQFSITRHLNAWSVMKSMKRIVESWDVNFVKREFIHLDSREPRNGDLD